MTNKGLLVIFFLWKTYLYFLAGTTTMCLCPYLKYHVNIHQKDYTLEVIRLDLRLHVPK